MTEEDERMASRAKRPKQEIGEKWLAGRAERGEWSTSKPVCVHAEFTTRKVISLAGQSNKPPKL